MLFDFGVYWSVALVILVLLICVCFVCEFTVADRFGYLVVIGAWFVILCCRLCFFSCLTFVIFGV